MAAPTARGARALGAPAGVEAANAKAARLGAWPPLGAWRWGNGATDAWVAAPLIPQPPPTVLDVVVLSSVDEEVLSAGPSAAAAADEPVWPTEVDVVLVLVLVLVEVLLLVVVGHSVVDVVLVLVVVGARVVVEVDDVVVGPSVVLVVVVLVLVVVGANVVVVPKVPDTGMAAEVLATPRYSQLTVKVAAWGSGQAARAKA
jgi:hypothetical protein